MSGVLIGFVCIIVGSVVARVDVVSGLALIVIGGIAGCVITWLELS